eukprot:CAMPEP_0113329728 /NCGR_PEP_ID=MMETSP0010_2-20120614/21123_1 /TAXON_ID=216773 ORGANISM="Corethron hystrix, Strain 308" /NCGR_SAMPLE_ID=MMETSP0010_2 /ASSEMBLY_ACC=CAM_ASM_000155 /LENGTH=100 /DNA_ID=CAMNT_0000191973 /DNA_START=516 /DNA_END=818 /DNA_ORIENTATION=+ /assembly_acc=CAM_ASM_000155
MQSFISGGQGPATNYAVAADASVDELKAAIENVEFIPSSLFHLTSSRGTLNAGSLTGAGVSDGDQLTMVFEITGGMRAKWRKKRMRRLRRKRRKMRKRAR